MQHPAISEPIAAVSYDIWNTLLRGNSSFTTRRMQVVAGYLGLQASPARLLEAYLRADEHFTDDAEMTGIDRNMTDRLVMILELLGRSANDLPEPCVIQRLQEEIGALRCKPEYRPFLSETDLLHTLERVGNLGITQVLISNTGMDSGHRMRRLLSELGILQRVHKAFFSVELGFAKPNPKVFGVVAEDLAAAPHQIIHVGDSMRADFCGATSAGYKALLYAPRANVPSIARLNQLPDLLASANELKTSKSG